MLSHHHANAWCCPQGPGPTFGNHECWFSHGRCPLLGLAVTLVGPREPCPCLVWKSQFCTVHSTRPPPSGLQPIGRPATRAIMAKYTLGH